jgi:hypothetical protein
MLMAYDMEVSLKATPHTGDFDNRPQGIQLSPANGIAGSMPYTGPQLTTATLAKRETTTESTPPSATLELGRKDSPAPLSKRKSIIELASASPAVQKKRKTEVIDVDFMPPVGPYSTRRAS